MPACVAFPNCGCYSTNSCQLKTCREADALKPPCPRCGALNGAICRRMDCANGSSKPAAKAVDNRVPFAVMVEKLQRLTEILRCGQLEHDDLSEIRSCCNVIIGASTEYQLPPTTPQVTP